MLIFDQSCTEEDRKLESIFQKSGDFLKRSSQGQVINKWGVFYLVKNWQGILTVSRSKEVQVVEAKVKGMINGPELWKSLHEAAAKKTGFQEFAEDFHHKIPCGNCKAHWLSLYYLFPPNFLDPFPWTVKIHNEVNKILNKPEFLLSDAVNLYHPI